MSTTGVANSALVAKKGTGAYYVTIGAFNWPTVSQFGATKGPIKRRRAGPVDHPSSAYF